MKVQELIDQLMELPKDMEVKFNLNVESGRGVTGGSTQSITSFDVDEEGLTIELNAEEEWYD